MVLKPDFIFGSILEITPAMLEGLGVKALLLDVDNTLTTHNCPTPAEGVEQWLDEMRAAGIKMMIVSNNSFDRVKPFAKKLGLDYVSMGLKPLPYGMRKAMRRAGLRQKETAAIGDQIFTDIFCANLLGLHSFYVTPISPEGTSFFRIKRFCERPFLKK